MLLSRAADHVYWAGRYLERVEDMARIVQVHGETHVDLPVGADVGWSPLLEICGGDPHRGSTLRHHPSELRSDAPPGWRPGEAAVVELVVTDRDNPSSILSSLAAARDNLRVARPVVTREVWELVNDLWHELSAEAPRIATREVRVRWLRRAIDGCMQASGVLASTMRRDEAMAFITMGQQIERADIIVRLLASRADSAGYQAGRHGYDEVHWMSLLRSAAAYQPFRRAMPARPDSGATLRFLLQDEAFPRSVSFCLSELRSTVKRLPDNEDALAACTDASVLVASAAVDRLTPSDLRRLAKELLEALALVHDRVDATYFRSSTSPAPAPAAYDPRPRLAVATPAAVAPGVEEGGRVYRIRHRTIYEYEGPVDQSYNEAHLHPRDTDRQRCTGHRLEVDPEATSSWQYVDAFGNTVSIFVATGGFRRLEVTATSDVCVSAPAPPSPSPPWESARWLLDIDRQAAARRARPYRAASRLVPVSPDLLDYAEGSFPPRRPLLDAVLDLTGRIHRDFAYEPGFTSVTTPVLDVLAHRRGVCQDFAHVAVGCVRAMGLAARYVSGYLETTPPAGQPKLTGVDASHAWLSVFVPGDGWIDVDPTNDQLVDDTYVTTAWGRDYWDVSPLRGSVEGGGTSHTLEVMVDVTRLAPTGS